MALLPRRTRPQPARQPVSRHEGWSAYADALRLAHRPRRQRARAGLTTAGGRRVTPHALRRTFATEMLNRGVRLETVSRLLGHAATTITEQAYAQLTDHRIRTEVEEALSTRATPIAPARSRVEAGSAASEQPRVRLTVASSSTHNGKLILRQGSRTTARPTRKAERASVTPRATDALASAALNRSRAAERSTYD
jgi:hypothetical protein